MEDGEGELCFSHVCCAVCGNDVFAHASFSLLFVEVVVDPTELDGGESNVEPAFNELDELVFGELDDGLDFDGFWQRRVDSWDADSVVESKHDVDSFVIDLVADDFSDSFALSESNLSPLDAASLGVEGMLGDMESVDDNTSSRSIRSFLYWDDVWRFEESPDGVVKGDGATVCFSFGRLDELIKGAESFGLGDVDVDGLLVVVVEDSLNVEPGFDDAFPFVDDLVLDLNSSDPSVLRASSS